MRDCAPFAEDLGAARDDLVVSGRVPIEEGE
jgi:hypothetical protein